MKHHLYSSYRERGRRRKRIQIAPVLVQKHRYIYTAVLEVAKALLCDVRRKNLFKDSIRKNSDIIGHDRMMTILQLDLLDSC